MSQANLYPFESQGNHAAFELSLVARQWLRLSGMRLDFVGNQKTFPRFFVCFGVTLDL